MLLQELEKKKLINPPQWLSSNLQCLCIIGSKAYGVNTEDSDWDLCGWVIPPKRYVFPHLNGEIQGFGTQQKRFDQFQKHHIKDESAAGGLGREYDVTVFSIVKHFQLMMDCNPHAIDFLYTPVNCILHSTQVNEMVREKRSLFLSKKAFHRYKGYAFSQLHKMESKKPTGKRKKIRETYGFDVKHAYHLVRLLSEIEQILVEGDLDLQEKGRREHMKAVRRGDFSEQEIRDWFKVKEKDLEKLYAESKLRNKPDEASIKQLLLDCLETHYGGLDKCIINPDAAVQALKDIQTILDRHEGGD